MAEVNMIRTVKLRSKENQAYSPRYNRANFEVPTDMYSTDLSQSYLDLTLRVMSKADGQAISTEDLVALKAKDVGISWGHSEFDYSPASLIKEAVLKRGADGSILESIPFCNIISQTLHQLTVNKEMEQSMSLVSGSVVNQGQKSSVFSAQSSILTNPINIHIPLSDIFQLCKSQNFWMSQTKGIMIELLFEDKLDLLKVDNVLAKTDIILDATGATSYGSSYENYVSQSAKSARIEAFPTVVAGDVETTTVADRGRLYRSAEYFDEPGYDATPIVGTTTPNSAIIFKNKDLTVGEIEALGIKQDDDVRMVFSLGGSNPKMFEMVNTIANVLPGAAEIIPVPAVPGQSTYTITVANITEWNGANAADFLTGGATATDITGDIVVQIDQTTGNYTLQPFCTFALKAYATGATYILPSHYLNAPTADATANLTIAFTAAVAANVAVVAGNVAVTGSYGQSIPPANPGTPGVPATFPQLVMQDAWYSDSTVKPKLVSIEVMTAQVFEFLNDGTTLTGEITQEILQGTFATPTMNGPHLLQLTQAMVTELLSTGLIKADATQASGFAVSREAVFDAAIQLAYPQVSGTLTMAQMIATKKITQIAPEIIDRGVYSNGAVSLPNSGRGVRLTGIRNIGTTFYLQFTPLDLSPGVDQGFQFFGVDRASNSNPWVPSTVAPVGFKFIFSRYNSPGDAIAPAIMTKLAKGLTYSVDKFELVLVQSSKNKKMPMAQAYPSYRVEPFTIQNPLQSFERQFNVTEANVFNVCIMSPHAGSLVSTGREINRYRWQINNISNTSSDIVLKTATSDYPSGMHLDKMLDYFSNSSAPLKNFFGLKGLECVSRPVAIFPLKIYTSSDQSMMFNNSTAFTAQVLFESNKTIEQGTMLFVKSVIKMI